MSIIRKMFIADLIFLQYKWVQCCLCSVACFSLLCSHKKTHCWSVGPPTQSFPHLPLLKTHWKSGNQPMLTQVKQGSKWKNNTSCAMVTYLHIVLLTKRCHKNKNLRWFVQSPEVCPQAPEAACCCPQQAAVLQLQIAESMAKSTNQSYLIYFAF